MFAFLLLLAFGDEPAAHIQAGIAALDRNNPAAAEAEFTKATEARPRDAGAWLLLAQARAKQHKRAGAVAAAQQAEEFGAGDAAILKGLAHFYTETSPDLPKAAGLIVRYADANPGDKTAWRTAASIFLEIGKPGEAIRAAKRGLAVENSSALHSAIGTAYLQQKNLAQAVPELKEAVRLDPYDEDAQFRLAQAYLNQQDFASAAAVLLNAKKTFAASPQIELALGVAWYGSRNFNGAVEQFLKTMTLAPDLPQPYYFMGRVLEHAGERLPEVIEHCRQFEAKHQRSYLGYLLHAKALMLQMPPGDSAAAAGAYALVERSLSLRENDPEAHELLGTLLERKSDWAGAAAQFERSIQLDPNRASPHFQLARVYMRLGRKEDAARERALHEKLSESSGPPPPEARVHDLIRDIAASGRVLEICERRERLLDPRNEIAPGAPPLVAFRYFEGADRHRFGNLDVMLDDAGH